MQSLQKLKDLGERKIVNELIVNRFPGVQANFDDAAIISKSSFNGDIVITTDPCPKPVACSILSEDMSLHGEMAVLINVSDLAAMGAKPLGILISSVMPEEMSIAEYNAFLDGVDAACQKYDCPLIGGNIKDGAEFSVSATALGVVKPGAALKRSGAREGDLICVLGEMGLFWAAVSAHLCHMELSHQEQAILNNALLHPTAKLQEGLFLASGSYASACMDCSDGVFACLREISLASDMRLVVERKLLHPNPIVKQVADTAGIDYANLMFTWGDWPLVCTVKNCHIEHVRHEMERYGCCFTVIGHVEAGPAEVVVEDNNGRHQMSMELSSERFSDTSLFSYGLRPYFTKLQKTAF